MTCTKYVKRGGLVDAIQVLSTNTKAVFDFLGSMAWEHGVEDGNYIVRDLNNKLYVYSEEDFMDMYNKA